MPLAALLLLLPVRAATPTCDALPPPERARAEGWMERLHPHACCDRTLRACLDQQPRARLTERLAEDLCRRVAAGQADEAIDLAFRQRAWTMVPWGPPATFDLAGAPAAGSPDAPVAVVVYASPLGPNCARMAPPLYAAVTSGPLQGRVRLLVRPFPLRSTPLDTEAGRVWMAAHAADAFWPVALRTWAGIEGFSLQAQVGWLQELGLDPARLDAYAADPASLEALKSSKREGVELGVTSTPTFFIDGRLYRGELDPAALVDVLQEAWEQASGLACEEVAP